MNNATFRDMRFAIIISFIIAASWISTTRGMYQYNHTVLTIGSSSVYPAVSWFIGLTSLYVLFSFVRSKMKNDLYTYIISTLIFWIFLIFFETIAYHFFNIRNLGTIAYSGLPLCNCIHAPWWMQISYISLGPLYLAIIILKDKIQPRPWIRIHS